MLPARKEDKVETYWQNCLDHKFGCCTLQTMGSQTQFVARNVKTTDIQKTQGRINGLNKCSQYLSTKTSIGSFLKERWVCQTYFCLAEKVNITQNFASFVLKQIIDSTPYYIFFFWRTSPVPRVDWNTLCVGNLGFDGSLGWSRLGFKCRRGQPLPYRSENLVQTQGIQVEGYCTPIFVHLGSARTTWKGTYLPKVWLQTTSSWVADQ